MAGGTPAFPASRVLGARASRSHEGRNALLGNAASRHAREKPTLNAAEACGIIIHVLAQYLGAAMRLAQYEYLPEDGVYYGEIPPLAGVWATGKTLEDCQRDLREVLEEWLALRQQWNQALPVLEGVSPTQAV